MPSLTPATLPTSSADLPQSFPVDAPAEIEAKLAAARAAYRSLRSASIEQRATWMLRVAELLEAEKARLAEIATREMGKTLSSAVAEVVKCATVCRYYAQNAGLLLRDEPIATEAKRCFLRYEPIGTILGIMPWNYPYWQVFRFVAPALMAGNSALLKHAPIVPGCAMAIEDLFLRAGFPAGALQAIFIEVSAVEPIIADDRIAAVTLTGSERAGAAVAEIAGRHLKKVVLELGGSDAFVILPSADIEKAVATAVESRMINTGQSCIAAKRILVASEIYAACEAALVRAIEQLRVGDPMLPETQIGPMAETRLVKALHDQVERAVAAGGRLHTGGHVGAQGSNYYQPTLISDIPLDAPVLREEFFGPVALLFRVADLDEAIAVANKTPFGLSASVWTNDSAEQERCIDELETGQVFVNAMTVSDARVPFGGVKRSGIGRELGSLGLHEFVNAKAITCK